jgi:RNA polymerase sigma-70 factor (ECF subfamily)
VADLERQAVHRALAALPEGQRLAIALVDLSGFTTHEAAKILNTPRGTVLSRLHRGRRALALLLRAEVEEDAT